MPRAGRRELLSAALTHLEAAAKLLEEAEEEVLADEARELTDKVDVVALAEAASKGHYPVARTSSNSASTAAWPLTSLI